MERFGGASLIFSATDVGEVIRVVCRDLGYTVVLSHFPKCVAEIEQRLGN